MLLLLWLHVAPIFQNIQTYNSFKHYPVTLKLPKCNFNSVKIHCTVQAFNSSEDIWHQWCPQSLFTAAPTAPKAPGHSSDRLPHTVRFPSPDTFVTVRNTVHPVQFCWRGQARRALPQTQVCWPKRTLPDPAFLESGTSTEPDAAAYGWKCGRAVGLGTLTRQATAFPDPSDQSNPGARAQQEGWVSLSVQQS